jgi:hypothetical protein
MKTSLLLVSLLALATTVFANVYVYQPLHRIPKADEIIAFSNGKPPASGTRKKLRKEDIQKYLKEGIPIQDKAKWKFPTSYSNMNMMDGVFFDSQGLAYFWRIWEDGVLFLDTESGESIQIILNGA